MFFIFQFDAQLSLRHQQAIDSSFAPASIATLPFNSWSRVVFEPHYHIALNPIHTRGVTVIEVLDLHVRARV